MNHEHNQLVIDNIHDCLNIIPKDPETALERISCIAIMQIINNQILLDKKLNRIINEGVPTKHWFSASGGPG